MVVGADQDQDEDDDDCTECKVLDGWWQLHLWHFCSWDGGCDDRYLPVMANNNT